MKWRMKELSSDRRKKIDVRRQSDHGRPVSWGAFSTVAAFDRLLKLNSMEDEGL
jgi:hypothetical protein